MLNIAIVGAGYIGLSHAAAARNSKKVNLVAIAEKNEINGKKAAEEYGCKWYADAEEMLKAEKIEIVDICLPTFLHEEYALLAAKYKKYILCEKPVALSVEAFDRMTAVANEAGVRMMVAQVCRFWDEYVDIKNRYDAGEFGKIKMAYAARLAQHPTWTAWMRNPEMSGGGLYDLHTHDVDYLRHLFGPCESVYAIGYKNDSGCWNHVVSNFTFKNGVNAVAEGAYEMTENFPFKMYFRITGDDLTIEYNLRAGLNIKDGNGTRSELVCKTGEEAELISTENHSDGYQNEIEYFADCIVNNSPIDRIPLCESRDVLLMLEAVKSSLETGEVVKL
ncbi:MAG: Gfo/Idh/MocA family oxidoreductase [Clostridia bacterium]|nr:Gfo/Idh/MocA family oxidoreductase [Clostridia bacterium]